MTDAPVIASRQPRESTVLLPFLALLQRALPRAKGAAPRLLGRRLARPDRVMATKHGVRMVLVPEAYDVYATMWRSGRTWDYEDLQTCLRCISPGDVFCDIGANVGYFALETAKLLGPHVSVIAVEPAPALAAAIRSSAHISGLANVSVVDAMIGDVSGQREFYVGESSIHSSAVADSGRRSVRVVRRDMLSLDDLVWRHNTPAPSFVKIDVEGSEHLVLRGAARVLSDIRPTIFMEYLHEFDTDGRIRRQVAKIVESGQGAYQLFGQLRRQFTSQSSCHWLPVTSDDQWQKFHALMLSSDRHPVLRASAGSDCAEWIQT